MHSKERSCSPRRTRLTHDGLRVQELSCCWPRALLRSPIQNVFLLICHVDGAHVLSSDFSGGGPRPKYDPAAAAEGPVMRLTLWQPEVPGKMPFWEHCRRLQCGTRLGSNFPTRGEGPLRVALVRALSSVRTCTARGVLAEQSMGRERQI